jgi:hypothetical protein
MCLVAIVPGLDPRAVPTHRLGTMTTVVDRHPVSRVATAPAGIMVTAMDIASARRLDVTITMTAEVVATGLPLVAAQLRTIRPAVITTRTAALLVTTLRTRT